VIEKDNRKIKEMKEKRKKRNEAGRGILEEYYGKRYRFDNNLTQTVKLDKTTSNLKNIIIKF